MDKGYISQWKGPKAISFVDQETYSTVQKDMLISYRLVASVFSSPLFQMEGVFFLRNGYL